MKSIHCTSGRRKTASARVFLSQGDGRIVVNGRDIHDYFPREEAQIMVKKPLTDTETLGKFNIKAFAKGGGISGQSDAVSLGIARALVKFDGSLRPKIRKASLLTCDSRKVERKKVGLRKARKDVQYSKR